MNKIITFCILVCVFSVFGGYRAVVCGISDYPETPNNYCDADAGLIANHLRSLTDWNEQSVSLLQNEQATKTAILSAIDSMLAGASSDTTALFFFFGKSSPAAISAYDDDINFSEIASAFADMEAGKYVVFLDMGLPDDFAVPISLSTFQNDGSDAAGMAILSYDQYIQDPIYQVAKNSPFAFLLAEALSGYGDADYNKTITAQECAAYIDPAGAFLQITDNTDFVNITSMLIVNDDIYEPDSPNIPIAQTDGTPLMRAIRPASEVDYIQFMLTEEATIEIETNSTDKTADTVIWLYNSASELIERNDDNPDSGQSYYYLSKITKTLPPDTYTVEIRHFSGSTIIPAYTIRVTEVGTRIFISGADFVYGNTASSFLLLRDAYYGDWQVDAVWESDNPSGWFEQNTLQTAEVSEDTPITVAAFYDDAQAQKEITIRSSPAPSAQTQYYAVIVGIADYPGTSIDLNYPARDATAIRNQLLKDPAWKNKNITLLLDEQATYQAIESAVLNMGQVAGSGDVCLFYYSGHGTTVPDRYPFDEADGLDECLYVYDGRIVDDEFGDWFDTFATDNYIVLIDACFSGGQIKSSDAKVSVKGIGKHQSSKRDGFTADIVNTPIGIEDLDDNGRGIVLTSSDADQNSYESTELAHGKFTYYLLEALGGAADFDGDGFVSVQECYQYILSINLGNQDVQIYDGNRLQSPIMQYNADVYIASIEIVGDNPIKSGSVETFVCIANFSDGSQTDITADVLWQTDDDRAEVSYYGQVYAGEGLLNQEFTLTATYNNAFTTELIVGVYEPKYSGGKGSGMQPYVLMNSEDITILCQSPQDWNKDFVLGGNIDMTGAAFTPIGSDSSNGFSGTFNGNGHTISNIVINDNTDYRGVFGFIMQGGQVFNLGVENIQINAPAAYYVGSIAGWSNGVIDGCYSTGAVLGEFFVGGISGGISGEGARISNSYSLANVAAASSPAGIVCYGLVPAQITDCYFAGTIESGDYFGAVVTFLFGATVENTFFDVDKLQSMWSAGGTGVDTDWLSSSENLIAAGWDYQSVWKQIEGNYPILKWQTFEADFNGDDIVDFDDMLIFLSQWLMQGQGLQADINGDGVVDLSDYAIFADRWLMN